MPILADFRYDPSEDFIIPRPYVCRVALGWLSHTVLTPFPEFTARENVFGTYVAHITIPTWVWNWSSKRLKWSDLFEDFYINTISDPFPISAGACLLQWKIDPIDHIRYLVVVLDGADGHYSYKSIPPSPSHYWRNPCADVGEEY